MNWLNKKEIKNVDRVAVIMVSLIGGFTLAYLHWGQGIPW